MSTKVAGTWFLAWPFESQKNPILLRLDFVVGLSKVSAWLFVAHMLWPPRNIFQIWCPPHSTIHATTRLSNKKIIWKKRARYDNILLTTPSPQPTYISSLRAGQHTIKMCIFSASNESRYWSSVYSIDIFGGGGRYDPKLSITWKRNQNLLSNPLKLLFVLELVSLQIQTISKHIHHCESC